MISSIFGSAIVGTLAVFTLLYVSPGTEAGCGESRLCCEGKDNKCRARGPRENGSDNTTCFCDASCLLIGDCCTDYRTHCKRQDCILADRWDDWGPCDAQCGTGIKKRTRRVLMVPRNGGTPCGPVEQKAVCEGENCKFPRAPGLAIEIKEAGKILPVSMAGWRRHKQYDPFLDIRRNLFEKRFGYDHKVAHSQPSYCARYQLTEVRPACQHGVGSSWDPAGSDWTSSLSRGTTICVECQPMAMLQEVGGRCRGHGVYLRETRWTAVASPGCHGAWIMTSQREDCSCPRGAESYILV